MNQFYYIIIINKAAYPIRRSIVIQGGHTRAFPIRRQVGPASSKKLSH
jgi:hypothetical protein